MADFQEYVAEAKQLLVLATAVARPTISPCRRFWSGSRGA